jgi:DNA-binding MarR family transcriptional regulator
MELRPAVIARMQASIPAGLRSGFESVTGRQLEALARIPAGGITMHELAGSLGVSGAAASVLADRLSAQGLVDRNADPGDRRIVRLVPTAQGAALTRRYLDVQRRKVTALLERLSDEQVMAWLDIMETLAGGDEAAGSTSARREELAGTLR